jgi:hypothetical protein
MEPISLLLAGMIAGGTLGRLIANACRETPKKPEENTDELIPESSSDNPFQKDPYALIKLIEQRQKQVEFYSRPGPLWQNNRAWELNFSDNNDTPSLFEPDETSSERSIPSPRYPQFTWRYENGHRTPFRR